MKKITMVFFVFQVFMLSFSLYSNGQQESKSAEVVTMNGAKESPMLASRVASGELPSLENRLPSEPFIAKVSESIGIYGGTLKLVSNETSKLGDGRNGITVASLVQADTDTTTVIPHLAKEFYWEGNETLVFVLRKGVKWSDGVPVTTEDVKFWWNDYINNNTLRSQGLDQIYITKNGSMEIEIVDDYTFKMHFQDPKPLILESLAMESEFITGYPLMPAHYMKQFHENYADPAALDRLIDEGGYENWKLLFESHVEAYWDARTEQNIGAPSLHSYVTTEIGENYIKMERNPYYWKVDSEGHQLPYIDSVHIQIVGKELYHGKVATGEADFAGRRTSLAELALYKSGEDGGDYKVHLWNAVGDADYMVLLNFNSSNDVNHELINNLKFRQALSLAIDREDFNEVINYGLAIPQQMTLLPTSKFYKEEYARSSADFNLDKANVLMDELGLKWNSAHEYRIGSDGKPITFSLEEGGERSIESSELLGEYWKQVGVKLTIKAVDRDLFYEHLRDNVAIDVHMTKYGMMDGAFIERPDMFLPVGYRDTDVWAPLWAKWRFNEYANEDNQDFEKPPAEIIDLIETWEMLKIEVDANEQLRLADILLKSQSENLWTLGITSGGVKPVIASNRLGNFITDGTYTYDFLQYAQYINADTWFLKK